MSPLFAAVRRAALLCLPFAAVFAVGVTPSTRVCAQTSGPLGWIPLPRSGVTNPQTNPPTGGDYDWTGLSAKLTLTPYSGPPFIYPADPNTRYYGGGGAGAGNRPMETTSNFLGTGGPSGYVDAHAQFSLSGTSTYYWQWVPPNNAAGQPDLINFPVPPLFVLGKGDGVLSSTLVTSPNAAGLTVAGSTSSGIGSSPPLTINTCPAFQTQTDYAVLRPTSDTTTTDKLLLSPSVTYDATGVFGQYPVWAGGESQNWVSVGDSLYPIMLSAPNPMTNPLLGDGTNQYVYDAEQADGYLAVPASVTVIGAGTAETAFLLPHVALAVAPAMQTGAQAFQWTNSGSQMYVYTPGSYPSGTSYPSAAFVYKGLPPNNTYFGNHTMTMKVDGTVSQTANYRLFFNRTANNWPGTDGVIPNWFHYWNLTSASFGSPTYDNGSRCHTSYDNSLGKWVNYIDNDTISGQFPAYEYAEGIDAFAWECRHEAEHVELFRSWWGESPGIISPNPIDPARDQDGDHIPDALEHALGMQFHPELNGYDPTHKVTPGLTDHFGYAPDYNDNEDYTQHMQRQNHPWTNGSANTEDWASPGHQFH